METGWQSTDLDTAAGTADKEDSVRLVSCGGEAAECKRTGSGSGSEPQYDAAGAGSSGSWRADSDEPYHGENGDGRQSHTGRPERNAGGKYYQTVLWFCCRAWLHKGAGSGAVKKERWIDGWNVDSMPGCVEELRQQTGAARAEPAAGERQDCGASGSERFREDDADQDTERASDGR